jgi:hypothetical protein
MIYSYTVVAVLGAMAGLSDLMSRYNDAPFSVLRNWATLLLAIINAAASVAALAIIEESKLVTLPASVGAGAETAVKILVAGVGGMAILRVGLSVQAAGETVNISLSNLLQPLLRAADNQVDRARAAKKLAITRELMLGLDASATLQGLPPLCLYLMQSIPPERQKQLAEDVKTLSEQKLDDDIKLISLGSTLLNTVGEGVLRSAVAAFKDGQKRKQTIVPVEGGGGIPAEAVPRVG